MQLAGAVTRGRVYMKTDNATRFWHKVRKSDGCWEWTAQRTTHGYGKFYESRGRKTVAFTATRYVIFLETGAHVPADHVVAHRCDNPSCVRPDHLFVTTQRGNMIDAQRKGRLWIPSLDYRTRTHCKHGHEFTEENTRIAPKGTLVCRTCSRRASRDSRKAMRAA